MTNEEKFIEYLSGFHVELNQNKLSLINARLDIVKGLIDYEELKIFIGRNYGYKSMPPEKLFYDFVDTHKIEKTKFEYLQCTRCGVVFYGCFGSGTRSEWNNYVKRCPVCHAPCNIEAVESDREIKNAVPMKDNCYGSQAMGCLDKSDLQGARCFEWGKGEHSEFCKSCPCLKCCDAEYAQRKAERGTA